MTLHLLPRTLPAWPQLLEDLGRPGPAALGRALGVSERTAWRWQASGVAPRAAALALYWITPYGWSYIDAEARQRLATAALHVDALRRERSALEARIARLERLGDFGAANAPDATPASPARPAMWPAA